MNRSLVTLACIATLALAACAPEPEPVEPANEAAVSTAPTETTAPGPDVIPTGEAEPSDFDQRGFAGTFSGILPCADCPGIDVTLALQPDGSYTLTNVYQERPDGTWSIGGHWSVEAGNSVIRLDPNNKTDEDQLYAIDSADRIEMLNGDGKRTETGLNYSLSRQSAE